jgi:hypothetical protein
MTVTFHENDFPNVRRAKCLGCDGRVVAARDAYVQVGGRRDGTLLVTFDDEPLRIKTDDSATLFKADDLVYLGLAHRACKERALGRLRAGLVDLPEPSISMRIDSFDGTLPHLGYPPLGDRCPFCDSPEIQNEDVIPLWIVRELKAQGNGRLVDLRSEHPRRVGKSIQVAPVCGDCNNRWMAALEQDLKPILLPLLLGKDRVLSVDEQELLATWAAKTAMMIDRASDQPAIPAGFFQEMRQRRRPLPSQHVWTGACLPSGDTRLAVWTSHTPQYADTTKTEPPIAHLTTFLVGYAVFQVFGHFAPGTASIGDDLIYAKGFAEIAPVRDGALAWPLNGSAINDAHLDAVAERLAPATLLASPSA